MEKLISEFSLGLFFWQSAIFLGLLFLLRKFAWKPILSAVNEREASIKDALDSAEKARIQMENLQSENQRLLKEARKEKEILIKEAFKHLYSLGEVLLYGPGLAHVNHSYIPSPSKSTKSK